MSIKTKGPPLAKTAPRDVISSAARDTREYSEIARFGQEIDVVALIAARSGVASATVRAHCEAFRIGSAAR